MFQANCARHENREAVYPHDTYDRIFSPDQTRKVRNDEGIAEGEQQPPQQQRPAKVVAKKQPKPINNRIENDVQRNVRQNVLKASESRVETNPQKPARESQYQIVSLPDGTELLKKRNTASKNEAYQPDAGHVLGRSDRRARPEEIPFMIRPSLNTTPAGGRHEHKVKKVEFAMRPNGTGVPKKPNSAFKNSAYQPDPGHVLGGTSQPTKSSGSRGQSHADPFHGRSIPRDGEQGRSTRPLSAAASNGQPKFPVENARTDHLEQMFVPDVPRNYSR